MDITFHYTAHRALLLSPSLQLNGTFDVDAFVQLFECRPRSSKSSLHVLKAE